VTATNSGGSTTASLSITVSGPALTITTQPASKSILVGQTALFSVTAAGTGTLSYQWLKGGVAISGATAASYTTPIAILADNGSTFSVQVSDAFGGTITSTSATLTVAAISTGPGTSITTGSMAAARAFHTASLLSTGKVLIVGGRDASSTLLTTELYDPIAETFSASGPLSVPRYSHTATTLADGRVLIVGGVSFSATLASAAAQFSAVTIWVGALDKVTGAVAADPHVLFVGEVDVPTLSGDAESRSLQYSVTSVFELLFEVDEGARLNNAFHQSVWPGELGFEYVSEVQRQLPWGAETARPAAVRDVLS